MVNTLELIFATSIFIMIAEFGDKTHLIIISLMSKSRKPYSIAFGGFIGITLVTAVGVVIGSFIGTNLPVFWISIGAGIVFITLGIITLIGEEDSDSDTIEDDAETSTDNLQRLISKSVFLVALAELGDKSQLFVITASAASNPLAILFASSLGMGIIFLITAIFGDKILDYIDAETLETISGFLFIIAGVWLIFSKIFPLLSF